MNIKEQFPLLRNLFAAYFHQDWRDEYDSEEELIKANVYDDSVEEACRTLRELDQLIALGLLEPELGNAIINNLGSGYYPESKYQDMTDWLRWIRDIMAKYAAEKTAEEKKSQG